MLLVSLWLTLLILPNLARAGNYTVVYSGGSVDMLDYGNNSNLPYYLSNGAWVGHGMAHWLYYPYNNGNANAQGQITATFAWQSTGPTDLPPDSVITAETSQASWSIAGGYDTATCTDGLGDAQVINGSSGSSSGTRYTIKQNPGSSFSVNCTPTVQIAGSFPNYGYGTVSISYTAAATPIFINVDGLTGNTDVLIGQKLNATVTIQAGA